MKPATLVWYALFGVLFVLSIVFQDDLPKSEFIDAMKRNGSYPYFFGGLIVFVVACIGWHLYELRRLHRAKQQLANLKLAFEILRRDEEFHRIPVGR